MPIRITAADRAALLHDLIKVGGTQITCSGRSMEPTVSEGDQIQIRALERIRWGDVVLFETKRDILVMHRVVLALPILPWIVQQGDAPGARPGLVRKCKLLGRAELPNKRPTVGTTFSGVRCLASAIWSKARKYAPLRPKNSKN